MDVKDNEVKVSYPDSKSMWEDFGVRGMPTHFTDSSSKGVFEATYKTDEKATNDSD